MKCNEFTDKKKRALEGMKMHLQRHAINTNVNVMRMKGDGLAIPSRAGAHDHSGLKSTFWSQEKYFYYWTIQWYTKYIHT